MKRTSWSQGLSVAADASGVVPLAGSVAVRLLADRAGLTESLSAALASAMVRTLAEAQTELAAKVRNSR